MLRGKLSLFGVLAALLIASAWSGMGMAADITPDNVGSMAASAKTAQDYEALANYYQAQAKTAKDEAAQVEAQFNAIHKKAGKRTGSDQEVIATQGTFMRQARAHYNEMAAHDTKLADMYEKAAKSAGGGQ